MENIELVIKIPEEIYNSLINGKNYQVYHWDIEDAFRLGTPLPKGHGRLIDTDELKKTIQENDVLNMTGFNVRLCDINNTPTVIEADKESESGNDT